MSDPVYRTKHMCLLYSVKHKMLMPDHVFHDEFGEADAKVGQRYTGDTYYVGVVAVKLPTQIKVELLQPFNLEIEVA